MKRIAVIGAGVSGLVAAYTLCKAGCHEVVLYEKENYFGGHARTEDANGIAVDLGFMVFNQVTYPNMVSLFDELGVDMETSDMSFSVSLDGGKGCEWGSTGLAAVFAQKSNLVNPYFLRMIREIVKFQDDVLNYLNKLEQGDDAVDPNQTLGSFLQLHGYSEKFRDCYLIPVCASIWSCSSEQVLGFSAASILTFCRNHHLLQIFGRPQWLTVKDRSIKYVEKIVAELTKMGCELRLGCAVSRISSTEGGVKLILESGEKVVYDTCLVAAHAPDALTLLGETATFDERRLLGAFQYSYSDIYLHRDRALMPKSTAAWSAWNFLGSVQGRVCVTYWLNLLQNLGDTEGKPYLVTLNPPRPPKNLISKWRTGHPVPSPGAATALKELDTIQGARKIWFAGAYQGYGFHEDGLKAGMAAANSLLGAKYQALSNVKQLNFTWCQSQARREVTKFLQKYIVFGKLQFIEAGGTILDFVGKDCDLTSKLRIHHPDFYWKIATRSDLGLAEAYMDGDFTCIDSQNGLLNLLLIIIKNRDWMLKSLKDEKRGWWTPPILTAAFGSAVAYLKHKLRNNSIVNARKNISEHYDLSNEMFSLFLDETMTYSCAIFKGPEEPLKDAQLRKIHHLIDKARIDNSHEVLEIGFGWGSMAVEVVRRTGCKYTGISLSEEQLAFAKQLVTQERLEDKITLKLCDYRCLEGCKKYNRIISCEMMEAVGPEYYDEFFAKCDYLLAEDGLAVIQVITVPEERYDELRRSSEFIKEYIFPGGSLPCLAALTAAMFRASSLCVEHLENIGLHYYQTLMCWRRNFNSKTSEIAKLGFSESFMRKWDYYFIYCAAGFLTCTLGNLQIVFSRSGNAAALGNPYRSFPTA
ncbi:hypothetical protein SELMODRAFT_166747 [Selaginella moellendorffii]|uniref:Amine oxidase domain-containing protein n=1 Tax=Selaginella moellendorffii TaxID=88036 RepID=D8QZQ9_SELML|nr:uncharacterized protein LOC9655709 [Selaginella moellendorffii]XP_002992048.1 uncharacterized protein LOC9650214 [Selaginella moellendorffii]EFJ06897.1 hypothetical protein SELMODRAFT_186510 [Selaginella moellendorffii]EFJ34452.1 hypothetical protein SELMODRAFT_166747 [Selaginella moellendorffii]|eukprot:XP_002964119.1 uncharacterized protein LOC9655709 [Selaginella moellendorffii]